MTSASRAALAGCRRSVWSFACSAWKKVSAALSAEAINKGLRLATGDVVAWLNSDDTYLPGALEAVRLAFDDDADVSFVHGDGLVVDAQGDVSWVWRSRPYDQRVMTTVVGRAARVAGFPGDGDLEATGAGDDGPVRDLAEDRAALRENIPADFWRELREAGLVNPAAPLPAVK